MNFLDLGIVHYHSGKGRAPFRFVVVGFDLDKDGQAKADGYRINDGDPAGDDPVRFEITETTRLSLEPWIRDPEMIGLEFLWPSRIHGSPHLSTRQYARIVRGWVTLVGLEPSAYGTHSMRLTKVAQI